MSEKAKNSSNLRLDEALRLDGEPEPGCNRAVADGIRAVRRWLESTHSASLDSKKFPLATVLARHVDAPYLVFARTVGLSSPPYSEWVKAERSELVKHFYDFADLRIREANPHHQAGYFGEYILQGTVPELFPTLNALIELTFLCCAADGRDGLVVLVNDEAKCLEVVQGKEKARHGSSSELPNHRYFAESNRLCELCGDLTGQATHLIALREKPYRPIPDASRIRRILDNGARIMTPNHSDRFCEAHSPNKNPTAYKRAWRRKEFAHAVRRLIILVRHAYEQPPHLLLDRQLAFALAGGIKGRSLFEKAVAVVDEYYVTPVEDRRAASNDPAQYRQVIAIYEEMLEELQLRGNPLYPLLVAVKTSGSIDSSIDIAIELGVIPPVVVRHFGFVLNVMARLLLRPEDVPKLSDYLLPQESGRFSQSAVLAT